MMMLSSPEPLSEFASNLSRACRLAQTNQRDGLYSAHPVSRSSAGMGNRHDLNVRRRELPVDHDKRELPEQKPARGMRTGCPSLRSLQDVRQCPVHFSVKLASGIRALLQIPVKRRVIFGSGFLVKLHFSVKLASGIRALLQIPVKRRVIFGSGFLVKLHRVSGHGAASPNCAFVLPPRERPSLCPSPVLRRAFQSPLPKLVERPRRPCPRGWKSANPPALPVPPPRATTPVLATCKLPLSFASWLSR